MADENENNDVVVEEGAEEVMPVAPVDEVPATEAEVPAAPAEGSDEVAE